MKLGAAADKVEAGIAETFAYYDAGRGPSAVPGRHALGRQTLSVHGRVEQAPGPHDRRSVRARNHRQSKVRKNRCATAKCWTRCSHKPADKRNG